MFRTGGRNRKTHESAKSKVLFYKAEYFILLYINWSKKDYYI